MNGIIGNGLFQRLALAALAIAAALACAVLWNAARAPDASAQSSSAASLDSCEATPSRIVEGQPFTLSAGVTVHEKVLSTWEVRFAVKRDRLLFDYNEEYETSPANIREGSSRTFERRIGAAPDAETYTLECVLYSGPFAGTGLGRIIGGGGLVDMEHDRTEVTFTVHPAPAQPPAARLSTMSIPRSAEVGRSFDVRVELRNSGGDGDHGGVSVSFPTLLGGSKSSREYSSSRADVRVVSYTGGTGNVSLYKAGDSITRSNGATMNARHLLIESDNSSWRANTPRSLTLRVTPKSAGSLRVMIRGWICADRYSNCSRDPMSGQSDQQGHRATVKTVSVSAPAPADDHGGSRSSATRIPDGSGENGVIGTADDIDVFSFGARRGREYTIETSLPSGSGVDTLIKLYHSGGSFLERDDNGGAGRASRIRWTAPSSATYYVAVEGVGDSTGAYRLSLSSRAPTRPPVARLATTSVPGAAEVGRAFDVRVELRNSGGDGDHGGVSVSFPTLSGGSKSSRDFTSSRADVRVVSYTGNVSLYKAGDSVTRLNGATMSARHLLIESDDSSWRANTRRVLTLRVTPKTAGSLRVMIRGWICADRYSNCSRDPASGRSDQQGYGATVKTVMVAAPTPADDHSDDISSATRISVGSDAPGVIGTPSDADYFSFQARSGWEYEIETSVASGSNVDTVIVVSDDNNRFLEHDDNSGAGRASRIRWTAPSSATYYVIVWGGNGSTGAYRLSLSSRAPTPADDHGDDRSSATGISADSSENGVIGTADDADYFSFQARRGWEYEIETSVASGSGVDTLIMLVDGGDRLLESDDNGGAGRASKMVWTAPSSATYYVVVVGRNDSTGAYRLSVSPRPLTFALLSTTSIPSSAEVGRSFDVHVELRNYGGDGERGGVSVSFPTLSGGSKSSRDFTSSRADVRVVSYTGGMGNVSLYKTGDSVTRSNGSTMSARHLLIESDDPTWPSDASRALTLRVTPKSAGSLRVMIRGWICADGYSSCSRYPMSGQSDQQGYGATVKTVSVSAPESAPTPQPGKLQVAPIGGLTAYLNSDGTDASGILSANYTLTNRVPNGETVRWAASSDRSWITVSPSSGSLAGGQSATVNVSINQRGAANLPVGAHAATVAFTNRTNGDGDSTRTATFRRLNTNANPADSEPVETLRLSRPESVAYRAAGLEEAWRQMAYMSERGLLNPVDIAVIDSNLWRPPAGSSGRDERIVLSEFDWDNIDSEHISGHASIQSSRHGYAVTSIIAAVNHDTSDAPPNNSFSGVVTSVPGLEYHIDFYAVGLLNFSRVVDPTEVFRAINRAASSSPDVVNMSIGNPCSAWLGNDICTATHGGGVIDDAQDTIFVVAAGNDGEDAGGTWPASIDADNVITVAATDKLGNSRGFWDDNSSNYGPKIDIAAPSEIHAVNPQTSRGVGVYNPFEGTSSAAPLVSGVVALLRAIDPNVTALDVKELLRRTGNPITVCVAGGDLSLAQCPADRTEDWIVMDAGAAVKYLMRHRGIPLAPADYAPTPAPAQPAPTAPTAARNGPIVFSSGSDGNGEIYAMNADGSGVTRLTNNSAGDWTPSWSPDGRRIAFNSNRSGNYEIYVMNADGSGVARLTNNSADAWTPSWSPDGRRIAFNSNRSGNYEIYVMNADGSGVTRLTNNSAADWTPSWSPDGRRIAFASERSGNFEIYAMNADGSGVTRLANRPNNDDHRPRWSHDGRKIAFYSYHGDNNREIYVMNADGSGVARLTNNSAHDATPSWSPDGRRIAFSSDRSGNFEIYAMNVDGSGVTRLTNNSAADWNPSWGPSTARFGGGVPAPAAPADDHGGSRSSATRLTRVSDGSSVSGNIETAGDEDYFAFQAERGAEYTIETRVRSGLDTVIELYSSGGSRLGSDDDGGDGAASKLVWMAPSSGTYYVKVKGYSRSETGGYRLSVSARVETPTPAPAPPVVELGSSVSPSRGMTVGESFDYRVVLGNGGGDGEHGGLSVSFPTLTGGSKSSNNYSSSAADVRVVSYTSGRGDVSIYKTGDSLNHANGSTIAARHLLIESDNSTWGASTRRELTLRITPKRAGDIPVRIRGWICADMYSDCDRAPSPSSGTSDQQGYRTYVETFHVAAPAPAAPADDHGGSRSSATRLTRVSDGASVSGNIETAGDEDYFAFQAERGAEYTIETHVRSGLDTVIELYNSGGSRLGSDDDSGDGAASKLVWMAPSSGTYYVNVKGYSRSETGAYELSLSVVTVQPVAPAPTPVADVGTISTPREATVGESFDISVELANDGGAGGGGISISFPSLTGGSASSGRYTSAAADVQAVNASAWEYVSMYKSGDRTYDSSGRIFSAEHLLVEATDDSWASSSERTLRLRVTPKRAGDFDIRIRGWICADSYCSFDPESGTRDQQGQRSILRTVNVAAPAPADDHGDTRSSATRISAGSGANGVIGTASDADYFSFQAERGREYTIETSIPSSSDVDTFVTLYRSNGLSLGENDDGGGGYASKLVWTAPSSGTYYVKVDGLGDSTGGYRLSVSARVETPTPAATPVADIGTVSTPREATVGESFDISVELANDGGAGGGGISISFPSLTGGSASSGRYTSAAADVQAVNASAWEYVSMYKSGDRIYDSSGRIFSAEHLLVEATDDSWASSSERTLRLRVTPKRAGDFDIRIRGWICADSYCSFDPESGTRDQQGQRSILRTVNVAAPAPTESLSFTLTRGSLPNSVEVGESFEVEARVHRLSGEGERGGISISFPSLTGGRAYADSYTSAAADVHEDRSNGMEVFVYREGDAIDNPSLPETPARHLQFESDGIRWSSSTDRTLRLRVTPKRAGEIPIRIRAWVCADGYSQCARSPVDGVRDQQGMMAMSASVAVVAPAPTPAPAPAAEVGSISIPREAEVGESFDIRIELGNGGGAGNNGGISVSFPTLSGGSKSSGRYTSSAADVQAVNAGAWDDVSMYKSGDSIYGVNGHFSAEHLLVEASDDSWSSSTDRVLRLRVTPKRAGDFPIRIRAWICSDTDCSLNPASGPPTDQQGRGAMLGNVTVRAPAPTPAPAPAAASGSGGRISFTSNRDGNWEIYAMNADGSGVVRLTRDSAADGCASWSSDGRRIAFESTRDGYYAIYAMNADGSNQTRLTSDSADGCPSWSPDGRRIAFQSERDGNGEIYAMSADGSNQTRLTNNDARDRDPAWSPDGRRIAFSSERDGNSEIYVMNADGSGLTRITNNSVYDGVPAWSPDGRRIAFGSRRDGNSEIYVMNADGSNQTRLTNSAASDWYPSWSPDGRRIAFSSQAGGSDSREIYAVNADGSGVTRITNNSDHDSYPSWGR